MALIEKNYVISMSGTEISIPDVGMIDGLSQIHHKPSNKKNTKALDPYLKFFM